MLLFLVIFLARGTRAWGIGLMTVSGMILLDALRLRNLMDETGYLAWVFGGVLAAGAFAWLVGTFGRSLFPFASADTSSGAPAARRPVRTTSSAPGTSAFDRQLLFDQIRDNLGPDDVLDLIFDLGLNENDVINPTQTMPNVILNVLDKAEETNQMGTLAMSVERILTPVPKDKLPRVEKLSADSPPTLLRQFLIANYSLEGLQTLANHVMVDWQELGSDARKTRVRRLLLHLKRRNRLNDLIIALQP